MTITTFSTVGYGSWNVPAGVTSINVCVFGAGGGGANSSSGNGVGGGGGACAKTINLVVSPTSTVYYYIGQGGAQALSGANTWVNIQANNVPTTAANGALALGGQGNTHNANNPGGNTTSSIGTTLYAGGNGYNNGGYVSGGGGGAGSGGAGANSQAASSQAAGTYVGGGGGISDGIFSAGGAGGNAVISASSPTGLVGTFPGGGGGGAGNTYALMGGGVGAIGANGQVQFQYTPIINVNALAVSATMGVGVVTLTTPIQNIPITQALATATVHAVTATQFIAANPTQALATTGIGSVNPIFQAQSVLAPSAIATTSAIPMAGDILIIGFDYLVKISGNVSVLIGDGMSVSIGIV